MIPSFTRRLSDRLSPTKKPSERKGGEADGRPSLSRRSTEELTSKVDDRSNRQQSSNLKRKSTLDKTPLSKRPTIELQSDLSITRTSSRQLSFKTNLTKKASANGTDKPPLTTTKSLSKKLSSAGKTSSLTLKPILSGRAPSLTSRASKASITKKTSVTLEKKKKEKTKKEPPKVKTLWYNSGNYVTVRNDEGGWFLCRLQHNVYNTTRSVKIRWLSKKRNASRDDEYEIDYRDELDPACILFNVRVIREKSTYTLCAEDRLETEKLHKVAVDVANGKLGIDDVDSDVEEVVQIGPPEKKRKTEEKKKADSKKKAKKEKSSKKVKSMTESVVCKKKGSKKRQDSASESKQDISEINFVERFVGSRLVYGSSLEKENVQEVIHPGITCGGCGGPVYGFRFKCWTCPAYDLCSRCLVENVHPVGHRILEFREPISYDVFHYNVRCDACDNPVFGIRHKCNKCYLYDLCSRCKAREGHRHKMKQIRNPINDYYMYA